MSRERPRRSDAARVRRTLELCQRENSSLRKLASNKFVNMVDQLTVSNKLRMLLKAELANFKKKPQGRKWTMENKLFALAIYKRSPKTYRFLCQYLCLPSESTLKSLLANVPLTPGICQTLISLLKRTVEKRGPCIGVYGTGNHSEMDSTCCILFCPQDLSF